MPYPIDEKLVVAIASSALFDLSESHKVYLEGDLERYREFQREHENDPLQPGPAFPFIKSLLGLNHHLAGDPVEVILLSRNDADSGFRVMNSIEHHGLRITRAAFLSGDDPWRYIEPFAACLFLSGNRDDVREALQNGKPAGHIHGAMIQMEHQGEELVVAFDFDGVLADHEAERVNRNEGLDTFIQHETEKAAIPLNPGPLKDFLDRLSRLHQLELDRKKADPEYTPRIRTALVTSRNAPAHKRAINTLRSWGIGIDRAFFLGGIEKARVLAELRPDIFFDDQKVHVEGAAGVVPAVHIPFPELNKQLDEVAEKPSEAIGGPS